MQALPKIKDLQEALLSRHGLFAVLALEVEWYLKDPAAAVSQQAVEDYLSHLAAAAERENLSLHSVCAERGQGQVEAALHPVRNANLLVEQNIKLRALAERSASEMGMVAEFAAKPYAEDYGSGVHVHVHLETRAGESVFLKTEEGRLSDPLRFAIGGLLATLEESLHVFAPGEASWQRFEPGFHAPVNASWGFNNRTTALRLPDGLAAHQGAKAIAASAPARHKRIEHRVAGSDADVLSVLATVLYGVLRGLDENITPGEPVFGDAGDPRYGLKRFSRG